MQDSCSNYLLTYYDACILCGRKFRCIQVSVISENIRYSKQHEEHCQSSRISIAVCHLFTLPIKILANCSMTNLSFKSLSSLFISNCQSWQHYVVFSYQSFSFSAVLLASSSRNIIKYNMRNFLFEIGISTILQEHAAIFHIYLISCQYLKCF